MRNLIVFFFLICSFNCVANSVFLVGSLGANAVTSVKESGRSESGTGMLINSKAGFLIDKLLVGGDLNLSIISTDDSYYNRLEENSFGVLTGIELVDFCRIYLVLYPFSTIKHDNGKHKGMGYKFSSAFFLPFFKEASVMFEFRSIEYDKKKVDGSYNSAPDLQVSSLSISFGFFFEG